MKDIYLIRHGRQCSRLCNVDVPLSQDGCDQARLLGERLTSYGLEKLYSSDLLRARQTLDTVNEYLHIPYEILPDIGEIDFGGFTGKSDDEIKSKYAGFCEERALQKEDIPYPDGGECGMDVVDRVVPQLKRLCVAREDKIAIVTHGGVIRSVCTWVLHSDQRNKLKFGIDMENTSITHLIYDGTKDLFYLERFNDFAHIEAYPKLLRSHWKTSLIAKSHNS